MKKIIILFFLVPSLFCEAQNYQWQPIIPGIDCNDSAYLSCRVTKLVEDTLRNTLWIIGVFDGAAGVQSPNCIGFNGTNFIPFPGTMDSAIASAPTGAIMYNGDLIVCGDNKVYRYDLISSLSAVIGSANNDVNCLGIYNGNLIVGGAFYDINGTAANGIASWNGIQWDSIGNGIYGSTHIVICLENYSGKLFVGGTFDYAGSVQAWNIATWDGTIWNNLCSNGNIYGTDEISGNHSAADVKDMEVFNNKL